MFYPRLIQPILLLALATCSLVNATEQPPNIILIFTDDQGYQDLGCFGSPNIKTPNIDRMAAEGLRLTSFYAQPVCGVSRAALMTGCYPIRVAEPNNIKRLHTVPHPKEVTIAEVLKQAGYATGIIGKWHLALDRKDLPSGFGPATMPNAQGFDYFYGTPRFNGFTVFVDDTKMRSPIMRNDKVVVEAVESWDNITADYTAEAIEWIKANQEKPFFLYLAHNMPHIPLGASEDFRGKSAGGFYGDTIEEIDWSCGEILKTLKELGLDENTLVIFTSDNGPWVETTRGMKANGKKFIPRDHSGNADPLRGWKMSAWDGGCRVPFVARWPGKIAAGRQSDELLSTMDLLPTFASLAGASLPDVTLDGKDATDFLTGNSNASPREDYLYYSGCLLTGVRIGKWKLVLPRDKAPDGLGWWGRMIEAVQEVSLFDLDTDPGETKNVAAGYPEVVADLMKRIEQARTELGDIDRIGKGARFFDPGSRKLQVPLPKKAKVQSPDAVVKRVHSEQNEKRDMLPTITVSHSELEGIGAEIGVMRRDPSDVIKVGNRYYVWYSKGKISPGYDATVWYATSEDGHRWTEKGMALGKGETGSWEGASVFTPNILVAEDRYWLFYTGTSRKFGKGFNPDSKIGIAVSDTPDGPWKRLATNPALANSDNPSDFDSHLVDDACLITREGQYWLYYKGRQLGKSPGQTQMGLAIAEHPQGPYVRHESNPVIPGNHEVLVWPQGSGVTAMIGTTGPKEITNSILYAEDGIHFSKTHNVIKGPWAGGAYRPEAFTQSGKGTIPKWGVEIGRAKNRKKGSLPFIARFDFF